MKTLAPSPRSHATLLAIAALVLLGAPAASAHSPLDGRIKLVNERDTAISVTVDGDRKLEVPARTTLVVKRIPNGRRYLVARGPGAEAQAFELDVPVKGKARLVLAPIRGSATIDNRTDVPMRISLNGDELGRLRPGESLEAARLKPGEHRLVARPAAKWAKGGATLERRFEVRAGRESKIRLDRYLATLRIDNPFTKDVVLFVDGERIGRIESHGTLMLARRVPRAQRVSLRGKGRILAEITLRPKPGQTLAWAPERPRPAYAVGTAHPSANKKRGNGKKWKIHDEDHVHGSRHGHGAAYVID